MEKKEENPESVNGLFTKQVNNFTLTKPETSSGRKRHNKHSIYLLSSSRQYSQSRRSTYKSSRVMSGETPDFTRDDVDQFTNSRRTKSKAAELAKIVQVYEEICTEKLSPKSNVRLQERLNILKNA